ncbi:MAG: 16S rRNA (cytosine(1402)-N(4))-methyltransferase RsmH [Acidimicrobiia bacterium]|nr:16S rRNA (cytosine(1402)-N(4))-methyltransferase RsmH [Acidimicrobiia bacterium]
MVDETVRWLAPARSGWIVDGTFGGGGHSRALLAAYPDARVLGLDRDQDAIDQAFPDDRLTVLRANYRDIDEVLDDAGFPDLVDGILLDLGVSSHQLDVADRGFSYHHDGPLDMRMGGDATRTAADIVNTEDEAVLTQIVAEYGEERFASRISRAIVRDRPFATTRELASTVAGAVPAAARRERHPARRTFQALRIAVNDELGGLAEALDAGRSILAPGGRFVVMAYHSLEDRLVKRSFADAAGGCICPPDLPVCTCGSASEFSVLTRKAVRPSPNEIARNPRARSAVLRVLERSSS